MSAVGSTDSHQLLNVLARLAIEAETDMAIDSYDTIVKMISNETEDGNELLKAIDEEFDGKENGRDLWVWLENRHIRLNEDDDRMTAT